MTGLVVGNLSGEFPEAALDFSPFLLVQWLMSKRLQQRFGRGNKDEHIRSNRHVGGRLPVGCGCTFESPGLYWAAVLAYRARLARPSFLGIMSQPRWMACHQTGQAFLRSCGGKDHQPLAERSPANADSSISDFALPSAAASASSRVS